MPTKACNCFEAPQINARRTQERQRRVVVIIVDAVFNFHDKKKVFVVYLDSIRLKVGMKLIRVLCCYFCGWNEVGK